MNSGHTLFFRTSTSCSNILNVKTIFNTVKNFRENSVFRASASCSKVLKDKKYFSTVKSFRATPLFTARKLFKNLNDEKSVTGRQGRQGRKFLPYYNHDMCKTN